MDGPFDPFSYASLAPLADTLWAVTWAKKRMGGNGLRFMAVLLFEGKIKWTKYVLCFYWGFLVAPGLHVCKEF